MSKKQAPEEKEKKQNSDSEEASGNKDQGNTKQNQEQINDTPEENDKEQEEVDNEDISNNEEENAEDEKQQLVRQLEKLNDKHLRLIAEYDNFRKRTLREKMELSKSAGENILLQILPVVDDFDRARAHLGEASDLDAVKEGIDLIFNKFKEFLKQQGITEIETEKQEFDGDLHEAVTKIPAPSKDLKGKIIDCIQKGYKLNDKVIRHPKVVVGE
jgi:molecular chaperone GrpE